MIDLNNEKILDGKKLSGEIKAELKQEVKELNDNGIFPRLDVILVGENKASKIYVKHKQKDCEEVGIISRQHFLNESTSEASLLELINRLNSDEAVSGILVQLPLPKHINENTIVNAISPKKDVDGFSDVNIGKMFRGVEHLCPCTPKGIILLLEKYGVEIEGKNVVVIGRSNIVGKPMAIMMLNRSATVTICHSKTKNLSEFTKQADILISAVGIPKFVKKEMVKENAVIIDVGINRNNDGGLVGDIDFMDVYDKACLITPVPGGVGPMTRAVLLQNTLKTCLTKR